MDELPTLFSLEEIKSILSGHLCFLTLLKLPTRWGASETGNLITT